jgi:aspartyl-tRNA(Asn)/glutamyl-tRNA(Gln) amidotransferase subunit A
VTGWKPTARRVPREGAFPLSFTLDSVGPIANSVACCAAYDAILAGEPDGRCRARGEGAAAPACRARRRSTSSTGRRRAFDASLRILSKAGAMLEERPVPQFDRQGEYFKGGGYAGAEAYHIHRAQEERIGEFDPRVGKRVLLGRTSAPRTTSPSAICGSSSYGRSKRSRRASTPS